MILIKNIKINKDDRELLYNKIKKILRINKDFEFEIYRKSIDARRGIAYNFQVLVKIDLPKKVLDKIKDASFYEEPDFKIEEPHIKSDVVIVGSGPSGLFCGYLLSKYGLKPKIIEQGEPVEERVKSIEEFLETGKLNLQSNVQFGEGGAGTFSDGKLTARSKDIRVREVLKIFVENGAPEDILYEAKPHIGTDILQNVIINMREKMKSQGAEFIFNTKMNNIKSENGVVKSLLTDKGEFKADNFVLGIGNSSRETFLTLSKTLKMENKPFAVGFRIEHKQRDINFSQYKVKDDSLPAANYMLTYNDKEKNLSGYTFCMCPGGYVINASSEDKRLCVNGMSFHSRSAENANSALIVTVGENIYGKNLLDGIKFQREIEEKAYALTGSFKAPVQRIEDFINNKETTEIGEIKPTVRPGYKLSNLRGIYPEIIDEMIISSIKSMGQKLEGFDFKDAILTGVETRSSSPVRIIRDENLRAVGYKNIFPIGEGAGYSGGIVSSAIDGIKVAEKIIRGE